MKTIALLPISLFAALSITACGDSESGNPVTPEGGSQPALSSEALPGSSDALPTSSATVPGSSETVPPASSAAVPASSATVEAPVEFTTDAVAIPDMGCTSEPLSFGSGVKVTCNGEFVGNIVDDSDPSAFDPNAAAYTSFVGIKKVFAAIQPTDKAVFILRHGDRTKSEEGGLLTGYYGSSDRNTPRTTREKKQKELLVIVQLTGTLVEVMPTHAVIDVGGVGYEVGISHNTAAELPSVGTAGVTVLTRMVVREDAMELYGFMSREERTLFDRLVAISGVGPKLALSVLSTFKPAALATVVATQDANRMAQVPGVGKRKAQRLLVDLDGVFQKDAELRSLVGLSTPSLDDV